MKNVLTVFAWIFFSMAFQFPAFSQSPTSTISKSTDQSLAPADARLLKRLIRDHQQIVNDCSILEPGAGVEKDEQLIQQITDDNTQMLDQYEQFAKRQQILFSNAALPKKSPAQSSSALSLSQLYSRLLDINQRELTMLQAAVSKIKDDSLKQIVKETIPFVEMHITLLKNNPH